jgi:aspartyl aminopeptidase
LINELFDWCFDFIFIVNYSEAEAKRQLIDAGFDLLNENEEWELKPGGRYFFTRNMSCLVAFAIGEK